MSDRAGARRVAAFDFDGTITRRDTLAGFLVFVAGRARVAAALAAGAPRLAGAVVGVGSRDDAKEGLLRRVLGGRGAGEVAEAGAAYAARLLDRRPFRPEVLARLARHLEEGHRVVVVSASLVDYVGPVVTALGADDVLASRLEVDPAGRVTGRLAGGNMRAARKAEALRALLGPGPVELWAYGDSDGDAELLALADHPHRV